MSEASSLAGSKPERVPSSRTAKGGTDPNSAIVTLARLAAAHDVCDRLRNRPYRQGLDELVLDLQRIFEARLVVIRFGGPAESVGLAPAGIDAREWLDTLDQLQPSSADASARCFSVSSGDRWPSASSIEEIVVVPLEQSDGRGSLWLGFGEHAAPSTDELRCFEMLGQSVASALGRLAPDASSRAHGTPTRAQAEPATTDFVAIAAHELRTPLTPITMLLQTLERKARSGTVDIDVIVRTRKQVHRLSQMISDLLDLTRLREDRLTLSPVLVELRSALEKAVSIFRENDSKRRVEVIAPDEAIVVLADESRLTHAMWSLIEHIARATPADDAVRVELAYRGNRAAIEVAAERTKTARPVASLAPLGTARAQPLAIAVLLARAILVRFGGTVSIGDQGSDNLRLEVTLPLVESNGP
jgi:signal transduction histidine kinase